MAGRYYVFETERGRPVRQANVKPLTLDKAKTFARIGAARGKHDRVVTTNPKLTSFKVVARYKKGTGATVAPRRKK